MLPLSLYESGNSNGSVSLNQLFEKPNSFTSCHSSMSIDDIIFSICCGGWPAIFTVSNNDEKLFFAKDLFNQTYKKDISHIDHIKRNSNHAKAILKSISRNICTLANKEVIYNDAKSYSYFSISTFKEYYDALERLNIIQDIDAWCPQIRSKSALRSGKKRNLVDPSIAVAALGLNPKYFNHDFLTLGF